MKCLIISGGDYFIPEDANSYDYIIVCDKGYQYALRDKVRIDLLLGDFDSYHGELDEALQIERYKVEKDDTDTMLAIKNALENGYKDITICSCFGGRLDHTLANIQSAAYIVSHGGIARLTGSDCQAIAFSNDTIRIPRKEKYSLSLFALSNQVNHLTLTGTKYAAEDVMLTADFPLGVSNEWSAEEATISCKEGILLVICSSKEREQLGIVY